MRTADRKWSGRDRDPKAAVLRMCLLELRRQFWFLFP